MEGVLDTASRMLRLLTLLQRGGRCSGPELADELGVSTRTIRADIDRLRSLGYDIDASAGVTGGYVLRPGAVLPPMSFTDDEALAVAVALQTVGTSGLADAVAATESAAATLDRVLPSRLRHRLDAVAAVAEVSSEPRDPVPPTVFTAVASACQAHEQLRFSYHDRRDQPTDRRVEPYRMVHVSHRWYLVAYDLEREAWRSFRLDRVRPRVPAGPRFQPRPAPEHDWESFVTHGRMTALWNYRTRLMVHADVATVAARIPAGSWSAEARTATTTWLHAGAQNAALLAAYLGALDLDFTVDPEESPELHHAVEILAARYADAVAPPDQPCANQQSSS